MLTHRGDNIARDLAGIEGVSSRCGDGAKDTRKFRIFENRAYWFRLAVWVKKVSLRSRMARQSIVFLKQCVKPLADRKAMVCEIDSGLKQCGPWQFSVPRMG